MADALAALKVPRQAVRVLSIGVGRYPPRKKKIASAAYWYEKLPSVKLAQKLFEINTQSLDQLRDILFKDVHTVRINGAFEQPEMATDLFESDMHKLNVLRQRGVESFAKHEADLKKLFSI